jgi:hypothetical protein
MDEELKHFQGYYEALSLLTVDDDLPPWHALFLLASQFVYCLAVKPCKAIISHSVSDVQ